MVANGLSKLTQATVSTGNCRAAHAMRLVWHINWEDWVAIEPNGVVEYDMILYDMERKGASIRDKVTRRPCLVCG